MPCVRARVKEVDIVVRQADTNFHTEVLPLPAILEQRPTRFRGTARIEDRQAGCV